MNNRRAVLEVSPKLLIELFIAGEKTFKVEGLPEDAWFRGAEYDIHREVFRIGVGSDTFAEIYEGDIAPVLSNIKFVLINNDMPKDKNLVTVHKDIRKLR